jgi:Acyl-CoA dehydrogenase, N-terminal domain
VNFDYTDDQKALKDEARKFLAAVAPLTVARGVLDDPARGHDAALWARIGEQGWCGAAIPEQYGGLGLGYVELCALAEELGRAVAPVPFASSVYLFAEALLVVGTEAQKAALLPLVSSGELIGTLAVTEGPGVLWGELPSTWFENGAITTRWCWRMATMVCACIWSIWPGVGFPANMSRRSTRPGAPRGLPSIRHRRSQCSAGMVPINSPASTTAPRSC